jgi:hypothetical protein
MARYINGKLVKSSADRKAAVESAGGVYTKRLMGIMSKVTSINQSHQEKLSKYRKMLKRLIPMAETILNTLKVT